MGYRAFFPVSSRFPPAVYGFSIDIYRENHYNNSIVEISTVKVVIDTWQ